MAKKNKLADGSEVDVATQKVKVSGPINGRWRGGIKFGPDVAEYDVTEEQLQQIKDDPQLKIVE